jgi:hypothetical protein
VIQNFCLLEFEGGDASEEAKRLLDDLLSNYNNLVRPVANSSDHIKLFLGIKLSQIADIVSLNKLSLFNRICL